MAQRHSALTLWSLSALGLVWLMTARGVDGSCPAGWLSKTVDTKAMCYKVVQMAVDWAKANDNCNGLVTGSKLLANPIPAAAKTAVLDAMKAIKAPTAWVDKKAGDTKCYSLSVLQEDTTDEDCTDDDNYVCQTEDTAECIVAEYTTWTLATDVSQECDQVYRLIGEGLSVVLLSALRLYEHRCFDVDIKISVEFRKSDTRTVAATTTVTLKSDNPERLVDCSSALKYGVMNRRTPISPPPVTKCPKLSPQLAPRKFSLTGNCLSENCTNVHLKITWKSNTFFCTGCTNPFHPDEKCRTMYVDAISSKYLKEYAFADEPKCSGYLHTAALSFQNSTEPSRYIYSDVYLIMHSKVADRCQSSVQTVIMKALDRLVQKFSGCLSYSSAQTENRNVGSCAGSVTV